MSPTDPLAILMVSDFYPPHLGGVERAVADLSAELALRGHRVHVATLWSAGLAHRSIEDGVTVHRLQSTTAHLPLLHAQPNRPFHPPLADPLVTRQLRGLIAWYRPALVHGHTWMLCSALPLRRRFGFATVATLHDYALLCPKKTLLFREQHPCSYHLSVHCPACARRLYGPAKGAITTAGLLASRGGYRAVDRLVAISRYVAEAHATDPFTARAPVVTIPNFVRDALLRRPIGAPLDGLPADYMLFVGALGMHKGIGVLLDAYGRLGTATPLVLIGLQQPDTPTTLPPGVIVRPGMAHDEIVGAMDHARFVIAPSVWPEPFGLVAIEAMARGKAVIAAGAGGMLDSVRDGETGLLVPPGDVPALAAAMGALLADPAVAARLGAAGRARCAAVFSATAVVGQVESLYRAILADGGASGW